MHGRGPVPFDGVHYFLLRHKLAEPSDSTCTRNYLRNLNSADIVVYSNKLKTVRVLVSPTVDQAETSLRVVEPDRKFSNVLHLREILRSCKGTISWAEPHLPRKALEPLVYEADAAIHRSIRMLSGEKSMDDATRKDFRRFRDEMAALGIEAEWRVLQKSDMDWHDRFILDDRTVWNVPPVNTLYKGDYSEAFRTSERPPFERWWVAGRSILD